MRGIAFLLVSAALTFSSCEKEQEVISGNYASYDPTVSLTQIRQFVQKVYLNTEGELPEDSVLNNEIQRLASFNCSVVSRVAFVDRLLFSDKAKANIYEVMNQQLLGGVTDQDITDEIADVQSDISDPANAVNVTRLQLDLSRLQLLKSAKADFMSGAITLAEVKKRMTASTFYAWANGSGNTWVESVFSFFLLRLPTADELDNANDMMNGMPAYLFLQAGSSDADFLNIFFSSRPFFEGQVRECVLNLLFREPSSTELNSYTSEFSQHKNHLTITRKILLSDEFLRGN